MVRYPFTSYCFQAPCWTFIILLFIHFWLQPCLEWVMLSCIVISKVNLLWWERMKWIIKPSETLFSTANLGSFVNVKVFEEYLNTINFRAPYIFAHTIFAPLIFAHPSKMSFRAPFNFRAAECAKIGHFRAPFIFAHLPCAKINGIKVCIKCIKWKVLSSGNLFSKNSTSKFICNGVFTKLVKNKRFEKLI